MDYRSYQNCNLCPRRCGAARFVAEGSALAPERFGNASDISAPAASRRGICGVTADLKVARAALHMWEEPCISGNNGSGAVFFSGCSLHCVFCQNVDIARGSIGKDIPPQRLAEILLELQDKGANNINLVTPGQYVPHIIYAVEAARGQGLVLPIVYNTSSYENVDTLKALEGIVDIYLPDFKYFSSQLAAKYSHAADYPQVAKAAIAEMVRQQPQALFYPERESGRASILALAERNSSSILTDEAEDGYLIRKGVIVRQLLLPGMDADARRIVRYLHKTYDNQIYLSLMSQFTPLTHVKDYPELNRKVTPEEYEAYVDYAIDLGVEQGFIQEGDVAEDSFIPAFDCEGV